MRSWFQRGEAAPHLLAVWLSLLGVYPAAAMPASATGNSATPTGAIDMTASMATEMLLDVHVNQQPEHDTYLLLSLGPKELLFASSEELQSWRLHMPKADGYKYDGKKYYPLDSIPGLKYRIDGVTASLYINASAEAFAGTQLAGRAQKTVTPQAAPLGGFLNYSLYGNTLSGETEADTLLEAGLFNGFGVGTSTFLGSDSTGHPHSMVRLDSTWTRDYPDDLTTLRLGDSVTFPGLGGAAVRFGGIQYSTNFATQPYLVTFPLPDLRGQAVLPSTAELYVNGQLQSTQQVAPGPFVLPQVPVSSGAGVMTLVIRDITGRAVTISVPYFANASLLAPGLDDYSFAAGELRRDYGLSSGSYGPFLSTGLFRHGFNDVFTGELSGGVASGAQTLGLGGLLAYGDSGVLSAGLATSRGPQGTGGQWLLGIQQIDSWVGFGLSAQVATPHFTQPGYVADLPAPHRQLGANFGTNFARGGNLNLSYVDQDDQITGRTRLINLGYSVAIGDSGFLSLDEVRQLGSQGSKTVLLSLSMSLGARANASLGTTRFNGSTTSVAQVQESLPAGTGAGYRLASGFGAAPFGAAELDYQDEVGSYSLAATRAGGQTGYQGSVSGGIGFIDGQVFASRQISGAFGLVETGYPGVTVYSQGQAVGHTDANGKLVVTQLQPYQDNPIRIGADDLPLDTDIGNASASAVPYYRSGVVVKMAVKEAHGATFTVRLVDGKPLPTDAQVRIAGQSDSFPVGYEGEVYVTGVTARTRVQVSLAKQHCEFDLTAPKTGDVLPDLGTFICRGISAP